MSTDGLRNVRLMDVLDAIVKCPSSIPSRIMQWFPALELANDQFSTELSAWIEHLLAGSGSSALKRSVWKAPTAQQQKQRQHDRRLCGPCLHGRQLFRRRRHGGGNQGSGGLPYVTMELDSGMVPERVRLFFQSVTGVQFTSGSYSTQGIGMMMAGGGLQSLSGMHGGWCRRHG